MTATTWTITDGTTEIDLLGSTWGVLNVNRWGPAVAKRNPSNFGPPYQDVDENPLYLTISGTDKGDCLTTLQTLVGLMDQAEAWGRGENVDAVYMEYQPSNSDVGVDLKRIIKGATDFNPILTLPSTVVDDAWGQGKILGTADDPIILQYRARGLWLGATEARSSATTTGNPAIASIATALPTDAAILMPYNLKIDFDGTAAQDMYDLDDEMYICMTNATAKIYFAEAESMVDFAPGSGTWTSTVVSGASAGSVNRLAPISAGSYSITPDTTSFDSTSQRVITFACVKNLSSTINYVTYIRHRLGGGGYKTERSQTIGTDNNNPQIIVYPEISTISTVNRITYQVMFEPDATSGSGDQLDVDWICMVGLDESTRIVHLDHMFGTLAASEDTDLYINHQLDSEIDPIVYEDDPDVVLGGGPGTLDWIPTHIAGNLILASKSTGGAGIVFGLDNAGNWLLEDGGGNEIDFAINITRTLSYLTPL